jgi:hypothetical protein
MDDIITMKVPAEVAAEWIAKGVGVPASHSPLTRTQCAIGANKSVWTAVMDNRGCSIAMKKRDEVMIAHLANPSTAFSPMSPLASLSLASLHCLTPPVSKSKWTAPESGDRLEAKEEQDLPQVYKVCGGCWTGCDACCPRLEDADYRPPAPVGTRIDGAVCECGRCNYCVYSRFMDRLVRSPAHLTETAVRYHLLSSSRVPRKPNAMTPKISKRT